MHWNEIIGWFGAFLFISSYLLITLKKIEATKPFYHTLNILGAICLIINASILHDFPNIVVNGIWAMIGFYAVLTFLIQRR